MKKDRYIDSLDEDERFHYRLYVIKVVIGIIIVLAITFATCMYIIKDAEQNEQTNPSHYENTGTDSG